MPPQARRQLASVIAIPFTTIGILAAVLVWEIEHVGSVTLAVAIAAGGVTIAIVVARRLRDDMDRLAVHYESLLTAADAASRQADAANRLKDEFLATLSHELRTPLNSILGWARMLGSGKLDAVQTQRAVNAIERAGWSQSRLIEDLLDLSRIISGKLTIEPRATLFQPLILSTIETLRTAVDAKQLTLTTSIDATLGPIAADPDRLQQIVWHLVSNAIKFTPSGGHVAVVLAVEGDEVRLTVRDDGIGLSPDIAAHLFERIRQGNSSSTREHGGLGLGLGIVRHIAELHGGTVSALSAGEGRGAAFDVRLPIRPAEAPRAAPAFSTAVPSLRGVSVLVVDDDRQALELARTALEQSGAVVVTATSAREARGSFSRQPPDVLVSDLMMPGEDGFALIRAIRALEVGGGRHTPAAALTALARTDDRRRALTAGFEMHVAKPVDPSELVITVERLARGKHTAARRES
jgi:signal transduction histidine kinase/ActR/RegA family two-component response regulator